MLTQTHYRFRNDDGNQSTATWKVAVDTTTTIPLNTNARVRIKVLDDQLEVAPLSMDWQFNKNGGAWTTITTATAAVRAVTSVNVTNGTATTEQLAVSGTGFAGGEVSTDGSSPSVAYNNTAAEWELVFQARSAGGLVAGDVIGIRGTDTGTPFGAYSFNATFTISSGTSNVWNILRNKSMVVTQLQLGGIALVAEGEFASGAALQTAINTAIATKNTTLAYPGNNAVLIQIQVKTGTLVYTLDGTAPVVGSNGFEIAAASVPVPFTEQITPLSKLQVAGTCTGHYFIGK